MLSERQTKILYALIQEHIKTAEPVASSALSKKKKFDFSSATIRNEFSELENMGFLEQPHTSGGRVPTSKAYRYFVDGLLSGIQKERRRLDDLEQAVKSFIGLEHFNRHIVKSLANASNNMAMGWINNDDEDDDSRPHTLKSGLIKRIDKLGNNNINGKKKYSSGGVGVYFAGLKNLLCAPEFENIEYSARVGDILDRIDDEIENFVKKEKNFNGAVRVYIGNEMPIRGAKDFSLIISSIPSRWGDLKIAIFGPQRMDYEKNLQLLRSVKRLLG